MHLGPWKYEKKRVRGVGGDFTVGFGNGKKNFWVSYATYSNIGGRAVNEDSIKVMERDGQYCFVVCDGLGGHGMGDIASKLVTEVFESCFQDRTDMSAFLDDAFMASQDILMAEQIRRHAQMKMKTTGVAVAIDSNNAYIGHIGDSRLYIFSKDKVKKRTLDHSIPQMLVMTKDIKESDIRHHPERNIVLRVLGIEWEEPMYELMKPVPLSKCQAFLLCTDGFWELIEEDVMCDMLKKATSPQEWLGNMAHAVKVNGAGTNMDNNSAIAIWISR